MKKTFKVKRFALCAAVVLLCIPFLVPLYYAVINSLRGVYDLQVIVPHKFELKNYYYAVTLIPFLRYLGNSLIICGISVGLGFLSNFIYGYAFARINVKGSSVLFMITLAQMMIPSFATQVPQYIMLSSLGVRDSFLIWFIGVFAGNPLMIFLYRQYLRSVPKEIEEAAIVDGCSYITMIPHIFMPICSAVLAIVFFKLFCVHWGDYMTPFMYLREQHYPLALALFGTSYTFPEDPTTKLQPVLLAAALLMALPTVVLFFICQKHLVEGVVAGSIKG